MDKVDARKEEFELVELFDTPALFTDSRISRFTVPQGWFCYDLRGSDYDPGRPIMVENKVVVNHAGTILTPTDLKLDRAEGHRLSIKDGLDFLGEHLTLEQFCEDHGLEYPANTRKYVPRPASHSEAGLFYRLEPELDELLGGIGHLRMDFGRHGAEFWTSWFDHCGDKLNTPEFKMEIDKVVNELRETALKDRSTMRSYCADFGGELGESLGIRQYGYVVETEHYRYCLRCKPQEGDYDGYLWCFDKRVQEMNQAQKEKEIQTINEQIRPFDIQMHALGDYYLALRFSFFEGADAGYGQSAFDAYAAAKGENSVDEHGCRARGSGYDWDEVFRYAFRDTPGFEKLQFNSEAGCFFCDCADLELLKNCAITMKDIVEDQDRFTKLVRDALDNRAQSIVGRLTFANGDVLEFTDPAEYIVKLREEIDYISTTGMKYANGEYVADNGGETSSNGMYTTDDKGMIVIRYLQPCTLVIREVEQPTGYLLNDTPVTVDIAANDNQTIEVFNDPIGGLELLKVDAADKSKRLGNATFEIRRMDQGVVTTVTTDKNGRATAKLDPGDYYAVEVEAPEHYRPDSTPTYFTIAEGKTTTVTVTNTALSGIEIHKIDAVTGEGIYGVTFLLYDSKNNVVGQYTSDDRGYVRIEEIDAGRYRIRELEAPGYIVDTQLKTVEVKSGEATLVEWKNTPITGQIQITKTSADYNSVNGWAAGTPIPNTIFEVYNRAGKLVDTIKTDKNGIAATKPLPLGRYKLVESKAADFYALDKTPIEVEIEFAGQIVRAAMTNKSLYTNVSITKRGYVEVMPGQSIRYDFSGIANNSNTALESFYWRDTLPTEAVRLDKIVTGTWNASGNYRIVYKTNYSGDYRVLADNLATNRNYVLNATPATLGLGNGEYVTEFMAAFGVVPANFRQVEAPQVYCKVLDTLVGGTEFCNTADVGGLYNGQWIMAVDRWVTRVYKPAKPLPRTGY